MPGIAKADLTWNPVKGKIAEMKTVITDANKHLSKMNDTKIENTKLKKALIASFKQGINPRSLKQFRQMAVVRSYHKDQTSSQILW